MNAEINENEIRKYLTQNISETEKNGSIILFGVDFQNDSIQSIIEHINSLYEEVKQLDSMISRNFEPEDDVKTLLPKSHEVQQAIVHDASFKSNVLNKILASPDIYNLLIQYRVSQNEKVPTAR